MSVVLFAAMMHATWNAIIKSGLDKITDTILLSVGAAVVSILIIPFLPFPEAASWPWLGFSIFMQVTYYCLLAHVYKKGDFSFAYPLMRGSAPLFTAIASTLLLGETLNKQGWLAILFICGGILSLFLDNLFKKTIHKSVVFLALLNAIVIASYTLLDGLGVRASGHTLSYILWVFLLNGLGMIAVGFFVQPQKMKQLPLNLWLKGLLSGLLSLCSYGLALWAMTQASIALVAGLRETSILFGMAIATFFLKERFGIARLVAVIMIMTGVILMKTR